MACTVRISTTAQFHKKLGILRLAIEPILVLNLVRARSRFSSRSDLVQYQARSRFPGPIQIQIPIQSSSVPSSGLVPNRPQIGRRIAAALYECTAAHTAGQKARKNQREMRIYSRDVKQCLINQTSFTNSSIGYQSP